MRPWRPLVVGAVGILAATLGGCVSHPVGPARTFATYEDKAATTAESALSAVVDRPCSPRSRHDGLAWGTYLSVLISEQEDTVGGVQGTFASIQPPDKPPTTCATSSMPISTSSVDHVADVRIVAAAGPRSTTSPPPPRRWRTISARSRPSWTRIGDPPVKKVLSIFLGILTAIGGFVDIGDLVANAATGARFELNLAWVVVVGVIGIVVYAEMCGRVAAVAGRPVFDLVRERLGPRFGAGQPRSPRSSSTS